MARQNRFYKNESKHPRLLAGGMYTAKQIAIITGVHVNTIYGRLGRGNRNSVILDKHLVDTRETQLWPVLETKADKLSAEWLNRRLVQ